MKVGAGFLPNKVKPMSAFGIRIPGESRVAERSIGVMWTSTDGINWTRVTVDEPILDGRMGTIVAYDGGYIITGTCSAIAPRRVCGE